MLHSMFRHTAFVVLVGLIAGVATLTLGPAAAMQVTPADLTRPHISTQLSAELARPSPGTSAAASTAKSVPLAPKTPNGPQREVFGFVQASVLDDPTVGYPSWDFSMLTTVAYFAVHIRYDGYLIQNDTGWAVWNSGTLTGLVNAAHRQGVKVVLTLLLGDGSANQSLMCSGLGGMDVTVQQAVLEMGKKGVDGINVDYEGQNAPCYNQGVQVGTTQSMLIAFIGKLRAAMPSGSYLSIDSYSGSGEGPDGFFNLPALAPNVDSFFVMAYDMEYYNWAAYCSQMCLGPTAPVSGYLPYNDTRTVSEYAATVPASKVILGVPYYGRKACVGPGNANAYPTSPLVAEGYLDAQSEQNYIDTGPGTYSVHRDVHDPIGQERFDDWLSLSLNCTRQLYWDDFVSLGAKYDLVNRYNLRGVGIFTLNYGGGAPELWCDLRDHFSAGHVPVTATIAATQSTTAFTVSFTAGQGCGVSAFDVQEQDTGINGPWVDLAVNMAPTSYANQAYSGSIVANGYRGHTYQFRVRSRDGKGYVGAWSPYAPTIVSSTATLSHPFTGMYTLDAYGGVSSDASAPAPSSAYWPGWKIARAAHALPGPNAPQGGLVLDGYGGLHPYGLAINSIDSPAYWPGWDIARDFAFLPDGSGGYVLDGYGGLHPFSASGDYLRNFGIRGTTMPPAVQGAAYWPGWDIARKVVIFPNGSGGYVLDGFGGIHAFGIGRPPPAGPTVSAYWPGWDIAHAFALIPGTESGYVMDGYGGLHPFAAAGQAMPVAAASDSYWRGWDIARGFWLLPTSTPTGPQGYLLDGYGGLHPIGSAPPVSPAPYWPGQDIARDVWGA